MTSPPTWTRYSPAQQPAAWLAGSGALLVMVATLSATAARWDHIPVPARLAGLLVLHAVVIIVAERSRQSLPSVSRVMAYLAGAMALPSVVSAVATAHGSWRTAILAGGAAGVMTLEWQARRWQAPWMKALSVACAAVAAAGAAAISGMPVGVVIAALAMVALGTGWERRAAALAGLAAATPVLGGLALLKMGPGTISEIGARGRVLVWAAPLAGAFAASVLAVLAHRLQHRPQHRPYHWLYAAGSVMSLLSGVAIGVLRADLHIPSMIWVYLPASVLVVVELVALAVSWRKPSTSFTPFTKRLPVVADTVELAAVVGVYLSLGQVRVASLYLAAFGWFLGALRTNRASTPQAVPAGLAAVALALAMLVHGQAPIAIAWVLWLELSVAAYLLGMPWLRHLSVATLPLLIEAQLVDVSVSVHIAGAVMLAMGCTLLLAATVMSNLRAFDRAAVSALIIGALSMSSTTGRSVALITVGMAMLCWGTVMSRRHVSIAGALSTFTGALILLAHRGLGPVTALDLAALSVVAMAAWAEHRQSPSTSPHHLLSTALGVSYLCASLVANHGDARVVFTLVMGVAVVILGALRRHNDVVGGGMVAMLVALTVASWRQLSTLPTWAWVLLGGICLIGVAITVEKRQRQVV